MVVSHAIAALEARHETKLFDRIGRRIALTEAGRVFLMEARAILARAGAAELALSEFGTLKRGTLCVQASQTTAGYWLPRHLVAFQHAYPRLWIQRPSSERRRDFNPPIYALPSAHYEPLRRRGPHRWGCGRGAAVARSARDRTATPPRLWSAAPRDSAPDIAARGYPRSAPRDRLFWRPRRAARW